MLRQVINKNNLGYINWPVFKQYFNRVNILDFETTGFSANKDRIIEVAALKFNNGKITDVYTKLCSPGNTIKIDSRITAINNITNKMVKGKPEFDYILPELSKFLGQDAIIAHNAPFDERFLTASLLRSNKLVDHRFICTLILSRYFMPNLASYKLSELKNHIGFESPLGAEHQDHRALSDVHVTVKLWEYLQAEMDLLEKNTKTKCLNNRTFIEANQMGRFCC